jgi:hypothetical protein
MVWCILNDGTIALFQQTKIQWFGWVLNDVTIAGIMKIVTFENKVVCAKHAVLQHPRINLNVKGVSSMFVQGCGL